jgi:ankyrin repeat protein
MATAELNMEESSEALFEAVKRGDLEEVNRLFDAGADVNIYCPNGLLLLNFVIFSGNLSMVRLLIERGADVNRVDIGLSPLQRACECGETWGLTHLIDCLKPLHPDVLGKYFSIAKLLIENGADVNRAGRSGTTPLHMACHDFLLAKLLVENGADVNFIDNTNGSTPLHVACMKGELSVANLLVERGASVNVVNNMGYTPLLCTFIWWYKCYSLPRRWPIAKMLIEKGADINSADRRGWTLLHNTIFNLPIEASRLLVERGIDVNRVECEFGQTPLHVGCKYGLSLNVRVFLGEGVDVDVVNYQGDTPLHLACIKDYQNVVEHLIERAREDGFQFSY